MFLLEKVNKEKVDSFWEWFAQNKDQVYAIDNDNSHRLVDSVLEELRKVHKGLSLEISVSPQADIRQFVISAEGNRNIFHIVNEIVSAAPVFPEWKIVAFRQRANSGFKLKYSDLILDPDELLFWPVLSNDALDVIIYGKGFAQVDFNLLAHYGLIMIDNLIGEYDCVMKVRYYDFQDINEVPAEEFDDLMPLSVLPDYLDNLFLNPN